MGETVGLVPGKNAEREEKEEKEAKNEKRTERDESSLRGLAALSGNQCEKLQLYNNKV